MLVRKSLLVFFVVVFATGSVIADEPVQAQHSAGDGETFRVFTRKRQPSNTSESFRAAPDSDLATNTTSIVATTGTSDNTSAFIVRNSSLVELFRVRSDGNVGVNNSAPTGKLDVGGEVVAGYQQGFQSRNSINNVARLAVIDNGLFGNVGTYPNIASYGPSFATNGWQIGAATAGVSGTGYPNSLSFVTSSVERIRVDSAGNVGIGQLVPGSKLDVTGTGHFTGDLTVDGNITGAKVVNAVYQDIAEWVPASTHMNPGTVVVLNHEHENEVMPSASAYDTAVAGVVSAQPGVLLGVPGDSKTQVATTGRVKVHVDATRGAIAIGDLLVTSDKPGTAMKSQPIDLGGVSIHRPGTVIGKALQPLATGQGEILVLLSLQ
jgi:hypothetical protein